MTLSTTPPKGTRDWTPDEYRVRKYIFDTWRRVCESYGYQEYLTPIVEHADVYRAKSGEDIGGNELVTFTDRAGRELCIRPEMTPSVTRMVSAMYESAPKPLRLFSIANFMRNERPQRGRNREFWQLNADLFGAEGPEADLEILQLSLDLMEAFSPPKNAYELRINSRDLINAVLDAAGIEGDDKRQNVVRILDKTGKLSPEQLAVKFAEVGVGEAGMKILERHMTTTDITAYDVLPKDHVALVGLRGLIESLTKRGYSAIVFAPYIMRGFDYYDGVIFELFDLHPQNNRAMFGGGRYNGLAGIFGHTPFPSIGFAPGDETMRLFLESWELLTHIEQSETSAYYLPQTEDGVSDYVQRVATTLRREGKKVTVGLKTQGITKALGHAEKQGFTHVVIVGSDEQSASQYGIKELATGNEQRETLS